MKHAHLAAFGLAATLAGCGGGGTSAPSAPAVVSNPVPSVAPTSAPTTAPTTAPQSSSLATATLNGAPGFVNSSNFAVYVFDADLALNGQSACTGACSLLWPTLAVPAGFVVATPWGQIARPDGITQLTYNRRPLYMYAGDTQPLTANGDGINSFGGLWHVARPQAAASTPAPTDTPTASPTATPTDQPPMGPYSVRRHTR
jgi:predicted lipoprotein with Yx(FWY)xxD motif